MKHPINTPVTFPRKLYDLIESESNDIVDWAEHGLAFVVKQPDVFTQEILPKYFRHTKLTSFQRQLNLYGFRRITKGPDQGAYFHPHFQKSKRELLGQIKRLPGKGAMSTPPPKSLYQAAGLHHYAATQGPTNGRNTNHNGNEFNMRLNRQANITTRAQSRMSNREEENSHGEQMYETDEAMMHRHQQQMYAQQQFVQFHQQQHHSQHAPQQPQYGYRPMGDPQNGYPMQYNAVPGQMQMNMGSPTGYSNPQSYPVQFMQPNRQPMVSAPMLAPMPVGNPGYKDMQRMPNDNTQEHTPSPRSTTSFSPAENPDNALAVPSSRPLMMSGLSTTTSFNTSLEGEMKAPLALPQNPLAQQLHQSTNPGVPVPKSSLMRNVSTNSELWSIPSELGDLELTDLDNLWDPNDPNAHAMTHLQLASSTMAEAMVVTSMGPSTPTQTQTPTAPHSSPMMTSQPSTSESNVMSELHMPIETKLLV